MAVSSVVIFLLANTKNREEKSDTSVQSDMCLTKLPDICLMVSDKINLCSRLHVKKHNKVVTFFAAFTEV